MSASVDSSVAPSPVRSTRRGRVALFIIAAIAAWLVVGFLRGPTIGADAYAASESGKRASHVQTTTFPAVPPFFLEQVEGTVTESTGAYYTSVQFFIVEPITGWSINLSRAGLAPSA